NLARTKLYRLTTECFFRIPKRVNLAIERPASSDLIGGGFQKSQFTLSDIIHLESHWLWFKQLFDTTTAWGNTFRISASGIWRTVTISVLPSSFVSSSWFSIFVLLFQLRLERFYESP